MGENAHTIVDDENESANVNVSVAILASSEIVVGVIPVALFLVLVENDFIVFRFCVLERLCSLVSVVFDYFPISRT